MLADGCCSEADSGVMLPERAAASSRGDSATSLPTALASGSRLLAGRNRGLPSSDAEATWQ